MSYSETVSQTFTVADIGKVIDCIAADLDMNSQSTGLLTRERVKTYAADVRALAQSGYLLEANIVLEDPPASHPRCKIRGGYRRVHPHGPASGQLSARVLQAASSISWSATAPNGTP